MCVYMHASCMAVPSYRTKSSWPRVKGKHACMHGQKEWKEEKKAVKWLIGWWLARLGRDYLLAGD
jgi:hypothetical protein